MKIKDGMSRNLEENSIPEDQFAHLMVSIISLSVFPIVARPIIEGILIQQDINYSDFIEERKTYTPKFILGAINNMMNNTGKLKL